MIPLCRKLTLATGSVAFALAAGTYTLAQSPNETSPPEKTEKTEKARIAPQQAQPTAAEMSSKETVGGALARTFGYEEYEFRSAAEGMPADKFDYRPLPTGTFAKEKPQFGPAEMRTFGEQVKHVACANFAFAAELDGKTPQPGCDKTEPANVKTRPEILTYLRDSFKALKTSISSINDKNKFDPIEGPYAGPNTRLGLAGVAIYHVADHYGQLVIYMRMNGIVPPASRPNPPEIKD